MATPLRTDKPNRYYLYQDLIHEARQLISHIANQEPIAGVAGVPRSGMLAASSAAIHLGVPLFQASLEGLKPIGHGRRLDNIRQEGRIVILEDSLNTGRRFLQLRRALGDSHLYASVFSTPQALPRADFVGVALPLPHWFDWWLWGSRYLVMGRIGIDFDGILCSDCPREKDTDDEIYSQWMQNVLPIRHAWPHGVPVIVSGRLEKYRQTTVDWLNQHRQKFAHLELGQWSFARERTGAGIIGHKVQACKALRLTAFIESCPKQARAISEMGRLPVACPEAGIVYGLKVDR